VFRVKHIEQIEPIRSSTTHPLQIAELATSVGGTVGITFCPGKCGASLYGYRWQRDLALDLDQIDRWGAAVIVTLVEAAELDALKVQGLGQAVEMRGMKWLHLPIADVTAPSAKFDSRWRVELPELLTTLRAGGKILVHCKGGLGRAGVVAAMLLIESGESCETAIRKVRDVRPEA